jgi:serine/threonine protein phosphatase PrpC
MTPRCVFGQAINHGAEGSAGFDAFSAHAPSGLFALCDGANSCADSGRAAAWLAQQITQTPVDDGEFINFRARVVELHQQMLSDFPETASTLIGLHVRPQGLRLVSVGDSQLTLYKPKRWRRGAWGKVHAMPQDIDADGHPSQLIASEVLNTVHQHDVPVASAWLVVMMSDGPARLLSDVSIDEALMRIGQLTPSPEDLDYLCQSLAHEALSLGCRDDISIALVWVRYE